MYYQDINIQCMYALFSFNSFTPESIMKTCSVVLTFESVDEILWCDHSNKTSMAALLFGIICFSILIDLQNEIWDFSSILILGALES